MSNGVVVRADWSRDSFWLGGQVDCFRVARQPGAIAITSYKPTYG